MGKTCYIIGPIGGPDTEVREWADFVKDHIIAPVVKELGYDPPQRSDKDQAESMITQGIVQQMFEADLVIADLTDSNPNVFYELGIRNCAHKPVIHLIKDSQSPPFDIAGNRAIFISRDYEMVIKAQAEIRERIKAIEENPNQFYSHVQTYMQSKKLDVMNKELERLKTAGDAKVDVIVDVLQGLTKQDEGIFDILESLVRITTANSDKLDKLSSVTVKRLEPINMVNYADLLNFVKQVKVKTNNKQNSLTTSTTRTTTTSRPPDSDT